MTRGKMNTANLALGLSLGAFIFSIFALLSALTMSPETMLVSSGVWIPATAYEAVVSNYHDRDIVPRCQDLPSAEWGQDAIVVACLLEVPE